jgi:hypothetical protein
VECNASDGRKTEELSLKAEVLNIFLVFPALSPSRLSPKVCVDEQEIVQRRYYKELKYSAPEPF